MKSFAYIDQIVKFYSVQKKTRSVNFSETRTGENKTE